MTQAGTVSTASIKRITLRTPSAPDIAEHWTRQVNCLPRRFVAESVSDWWPLPPDRQDWIGPASSASGKPISRASIDPDNGMETGTGIDTGIGTGTESGTYNAFGTDIGSRSRTDIEGKTHRVPSRYRIDEGRSISFYENCSRSAL